MVRVKICGITNVRDALIAVRLGADALGFNFYKLSPRYVDKERVKAIVAALPPFVTPVGVFVDADREEVEQICAYCGLPVAQLHGDESPKYVHSLRHVQRVKAFRIREEKDLRLLERYRVEAYLLDASVPGVPGGTGQQFDWKLAYEARKYGPIIVAGGLTPENVAEAIREAQPYAVDVASGVESQPGRKDKAILAAFIQRAKAVSI